MSFHLFGSVLTAEGIASNNRGENAGNVATLQKVLRSGSVYTTVSAEAIRYAMREYWSERSETEPGLELNRVITPEGSTWTSPKDFKEDKYIDDDLFGYMNPKKETVKRRGRFEITRALSTRPWTGDVMFNVASVGSQPSNNKNPVPYGVEVHTTRYQYLFSLTPAKLEVPTRIGYALDAVQNLSSVAGNQSRYLYDFSPEAVILRWTHDPAPRMMFCYEEDEYGMLSIEKVIQALEAGDIEPGELVCGGVLLKPFAEQLESFGVEVHAGVKAAFSAIRERAGKDLEL